MGMTMTKISNNLSANHFQKTEAAGSNQASSENDAFSSILARQAPAPAQNQPSSANSAAQSTTENNTPMNDAVAQADKAAPKENTVEAENETTSEDSLRTAQMSNEALPVNLLAEPALLQQIKPEAGTIAGDKGKTSLENTILSQLIEPQRNLANRLSGKNQATLKPEAQAASGSLARFAKDTLAGSAKATSDTLLNTENSQLTASQLATLDKQSVAGRAINLNANKEAADQLRASLFGRLSADTVTTDPADARNFNLKTSAQPWSNQMMAADQAANNLPESSFAANSNAASSASVTNTQAQAPTSPLIPIGASFYHPGWSQAMAQQVATQASLFFRQQANGTHIAQMRLDPPELGPIKVSISIQDGVAQAAFVASNATVRQALENSLADLHQALQEKGLSLGQAHVGQQDRQETFLMDDNTPSRSAVAQTEDSPAGLPDVARPATGNSRQHDGLISTFA